MDGFGPFIKRVREAKGWSLREAARTIGLSHFRLSEIESGKNARTGHATRPSWNQVASIARAYGLDQATLLARAGYDVGDRSELSPDELDVLLLFAAVPAERRGLVRAMLLAFGTVDLPERPPSL